MKILILVFLALLVVTFCDDEFPLEKDVIILTDSTFDKAIEKYEYLLVLFYGPSCSHCKRFEPEYEKAASILRKENLNLAKVDATAEKKLAEKFEIEELPAIKLFIKEGEQQLEYNGGGKDSEIINWMRRKTGPVAKDLKTFEDVEKFKKDNNVSLVYFGSKKEDIKEIIKVARKNDRFPFAIVKSEEVIKKYSKPGTAVLFKNFDEKKRELADIREKVIEEFIFKYFSPKVILNFDQQAAYIIFGRSIPAIILYASEKSEKWADYKNLMGNVANKINDNIKAVLTDIKEGLASRLGEYIGVKEKHLPTVRIIDTRGAIKHYKMNGEINEQNILNFIDDWENKRLKQYFKTEDEPKDNNGDVLIVVGKTFKREVINNDKDVMIFFYSPWISQCNELHPKYEDVAKKLKEKNPKLVLAKCNATENEVESVNISGFPTVKFYPGNKKDQAPLIMVIEVLMI